MRYTWFLGILLLCSISSSYGQNGLKLSLIENRVTYKVGDLIGIRVVIEDSLFNKLDNKELTITYGKEEASNVNFKASSYSLKSNITVLQLAAAETPQILRIKAAISVQGKSLIREVGVAISPEELVTTTTKPEDFDNFWDEQIKSIKEVPLNSKVQLAENLSSSLCDAYYVSYQTDKSGARFYGVLTIPKGDKDSKYPVVVIFPGAGVRGYAGDSRFAKDSIITLQLGIHGIPIDQKKETYDALASGALNGYQYYNLQDREHYYFNRVIKGAVRSLDFIETLEQFDGKNIMANGSSQGGALSLIVTALDKRIKAAAVYCPAMCQTNGNLTNQATGWPKPLMRADLNASYTENWNSVIPYYDVANFTSDIEVPVFFTFGLIDDVTPATTIFGAYNRIPADKIYYLKADVAHANELSQINKVNAYI